MQPWIGVDLDGTLAEYNGWVDGWHIGPPVQKMVDRVRKIINEDKIEVRIFTARIAGGERRLDAKTVTKLIQDWLEKECNLPRLKVTNVKDFGMVELYDDRAIQVEFNTGELVGFSTKEHRKLMKKDSE